MDYKRAVLAALITYGITLVIGLLAAFGLGIGFEDTQSGDISLFTWLFGGATSIVAVVLGSLWYFKKQGTVANTNTGIHLGLVMIAVSFALDILSFLPMLGDEETMRLLQSYYGSAFFWVIVGLVLLTTFAVAKYKENYEKKSKKSSK